MKNVQSSCQSSNCLLEAGTGGDGGAEITVDWIRGDGGFVSGNWLPRVTVGEILKLAVKVMFAGRNEDGIKRVVAIEIMLKWLVSNDWLSECCAHIYIYIYIYIPSRKKQNSVTLGL